MCAACSVIQRYPTLRDPTDCSSLGPSVHGILQVRILEWVENKTRYISTKGKEIRVLERYLHPHVHCRVIHCNRVLRIKVSVHQQRKG